jgi:hypothetical protein
MLEVPVLGMTCLDCQDFCHVKWTNLILLAIRPESRCAISREQDWSITQVVPFLLEVEITPLGKSLSSGMLVKLGLFSSGVGFFCVYIKSL